MASTSFSVQRARDIVKDLLQSHNPWIYWTDFLVTLTIGYAAGAVYLKSPLFSPQQIACYFIAGFALFRVGSYIHEIVHLTGNQLRYFRIAWNILAGVPMLMPSFFYSNHVDHHSTKHYGTGQDGEYLPLGSGALKEIWHFYLQIMFLPLFVFFRFLILTPISFLHPKLRQWTLERASSFVINLQYRHRVPRNAPRKVWAALEILCFLRALAIPVAVLSGFVPVSRLFLLYALAIMTLGLNYIRNLVAHRYESLGEPISHVEQLQDSINLNGVPVLTELFFPLSLRYHALHHLFPSMPYHNLPEAHQRLITQLPEGSDYHQTVYPGFWARATELLKLAAQTQRRRRQNGAEVWHDRREEWFRNWDAEAPRAEMPEYPKPADAVLEAPSSVPPSHIPPADAPVAAPLPARRSA